MCGRCRPGMLRRHRSGEDECNNQKDGDVLFHEHEAPNRRGFGTVSYDIAACRWLEAEIGGSDAEECRETSPLAKSASSQGAIRERPVELRRETYYAA